MTLSPSSDASTPAQLAGHVRRLFPSLYVIFLGTLTLLLSLALGVLMLSADPVDFSLERKHEMDTLAYGVFAFGATHFLATLAGAIAGLLHMTWARHLLAALAVIGSIAVLIGLVGVAFLAACAPFAAIMLIIADIVLLKTLYSGTS